MNQLQNHNPTTDPMWCVCGTKPTLADLEMLGHMAAMFQFYANWNIGDVARIAARNNPDTWQQCFPEWISPDHIARCKAVAEAYPPADRNPLASWTTHMRNANKPDRLRIIQEHVDAGRTSDEAAKATPKKTGWLLAIDCNYYIHRFFHSGAGIETGKSVAEFIERTIDRLKEFKPVPLTDAVCCFDGPNNFRKELTKDWEKPYKGNRGPKDPELAQQIKVCRELLEVKGFCCVSFDGMEGDDLMCSYAHQFKGRTTLMTNDKDQRQCLSDTCNILQDIEWIEDETSGSVIPEYKWLNQAKHIQETGLTPQEFLEAQCIMGDPVDNIAGVPGIGEKGAAKLIQEYGSLEAVIEAAKNDTINVNEKKRDAIVAFAGEQALITRQLVTMRNDLELPWNTGI